MTPFMDAMYQRLREAIRHFWAVRERQAAGQGGAATEGKDRGERGAVTGGRQMDGFIHLVHTLLVEAGLTSASVFCRTRPASEEVRGRKRRPPGEPAATQTVLPGWFRAEKDWDLLVIEGDCLIAAVEFKLQVGPSFGNNFNNRTEEALGSAIDLWMAYREGAYRPSQRPWLGYLMLLEDTPGSTRPVNVSEPHFKVFPEFRDASYARRYEILLTKLVRERLYDAACFLTATRGEGLQGESKEPNPELNFSNLIASLLGRASAAAKVSPRPPDPGQD